MTSTKPRRASSLPERQSDAELRRLSQERIAKRPDLVHLLDGTAEGTRRIGRRKPAAKLVKADPDTRVAQAPDRHTLTLPFDVLVSDNAKYGVLNGRIILTKKYRTAKDAAHDMAREQCEPNGGPIAGPVTLLAYVYEPKGTRRDLLNYCKMLCDSLTGVCYGDDKQITVAQMVRVEGEYEGEPRVEITIRPLEDA